MKNRCIYIIKSGSYYHEGFFEDYYYRTKAAAEKEIRRRGLRWSSEQGMFENDSAQTWARVVSFDPAEEG